MLEQMPEAILLVSMQDGTILYNNPSAEKLFEYDKGEMVGLSIATLNNPDWKNPPQTSADIVNILNQRGEWRGEIRNIKKDGTPIWCSSTATTFTDPVYGEVWLGVYRDITELKDTTETLRQSAERMQMVIDATNDGIWDWNILTHEYYFSPRWKEIVGYRDDELPNLDSVFFDLIHPDDKSLITQAITQHFENHEPFQAEIRLRHKDGSYRWVFTRGEAMRDTNGRPVRMLGSVTDISDRKKVQESLENSLEFSKNLISSMQNGFLVLDKNSCAVDVNPAFLHMIGFSREELIGVRAPHPYWPPEEYETIDAAFQKTLKGEASSFELIFMRKNGERFPVIVSASAVKDLKGNIVSYIAIVKDITERKRAEIALLQNEKKLISDLKRRARIEMAIQYVSAAISFDTGETFLQNLAAELAQSVGADIAFIGVTDVLDQQVINTLSVYAHGKHVANFTYPLLHTPCANVVGKRSCIYPEQVATMFPEDKLLQDMGIEGYVGSPMFDADGQPLGLLAVLDSKPIADPTMVVQILEIFTIRAASEIARLRHEQQLRIAATAFEAQESLMITDANGVILRVNKAFTKSTGYTAEEALGQTPRLLQSGRHSADFYRAMWDSINRTGFWQGEVWDKRKDGEIYPKLLTISAVKDSNGIVTHYVGAHLDITDRKEAEKEIHLLAYYDPLTCLPNRRLLMDRLQQVLASSLRSGRVSALLLIDLDNFKSLNDTLGHQIGDLLLIQVAQRLQSTVRDEDTVARLGGDEFIVILAGLSEQLTEAAAKAEAIGEKVLAAINLSFQLDSNEYHGTASIGITLFNDNRQAMDDLIKQADIAMYQAKKFGRNMLRFFDPQMQASINARVLIEDELYRALDKQQFCLYYQVQVDSSHRPLGAEVLIRWNHPERGLVPPMQFIPLAEESGLILPIGHWVLETTCAQIKAWQQDVHTRHLVLAVNVSAKQFHQADFVAQVQAAVQRHNINPKLLKLELTEGIMLENIEDTITTMNALHNIGVMLSLDDFGTGYSSLQYLKKLPLDQLKIDQSFVRDITVDDSDKTIVRTIIVMAQSLNLNVIAEGVETDEQRQILSFYGCQHYQGYLFGKPVPIEEFEISCKKLGLAFL